MVSFNLFVAFGRPGTSIDGYLTGQRVVSNFTSHRRRRRRPGRERYTFDPSTQHGAAHHTLEPHHRDRFTHQRTVVV